MKTINLNIVEMIKSIRAIGIVATAKKYGWRFVALIFAYYFIRDMTLYVLIPYFIISRVAQ